MAAKINYFTFNIDFLKLLSSLKNFTKFGGPCSHSNPINGVWMPKSVGSIAYSFCIWFPNGERENGRTAVCHRSSSKTLKICSASVV